GRHVNRRANRGFEESQRGSLVGDPIRAAERSESAIGVGAAAGRVFRANKKARNEAKRVGKRRGKTSFQLGAFRKLAWRGRGLRLGKSMRVIGKILRVRWRGAGALARLLLL